MMSGLIRRADSFRLALSFLTVLPVGMASPPRELAPARAYFPLVGLLLGGALAALDLGLRQAFPPAVVGALVLAAAVVATRAIHVEGFVDSCDGLLGGATRERRLEILRDPRVGAFGVVGGVVLLLVQFTALAELPGRVRIEMLVLFPALSRWAVLAAMEAFPYARREGMGTGFQAGRTRWQMAAGFAVALAASLGLAGVAGVVLLAIASFVALVLGRWMAGMLGGLTGDSYGAINELAAVAVLLAAIVLGNEASSLYGAPFYSGG